MTTDDLTCPLCGGKGHCNGKPGVEHNHSCASCGHQTFESLPDLVASLAERDAEGDRMHAALGLLIEWALDALPKIKATASAEYTLMPGAILDIGRTFGPFHEGARWSDDPQMPVMRSVALFDQLDAWANGETLTVTGEHAESWRRLAHEHGVDAAALLAVSARVVGNALATVPLPGDFDPLPAARRFTEEKEQLDG